MPYLYAIALESTIIQNGNTKAILQNGFIFTIFGHINGPSVCSKRNWDTKFKLVNCSNRLNVSVMLPVQAAASNLCNPNSKDPIDINELSHAMVAELIDLFCSQGGHVMDPFSTAMLTEVETLQVNRTVCVLKNTQPALGQQYNGLRHFFRASMRF